MAALPSIIKIRSKSSAPLRKIMRKIWRYGGKIVILHTERDNGRIGLDRDTHQIISKKENTSHVNGGPHPSGELLQPVDYKDGKLSNHEKTEFSSHHRYDHLFC